ncbi:MAG: HAMP domain-containing protein [Chloroherpetonaceae bacterium]|nr:HAMP domain-containing protein [Chloroherpetonaceae bacterium]MDW8438729.1 adenylate/guanylate cyclase domain-containing protein [Chloroherpetonaceae bacterium]
MMRFNIQAKLFLLLAGITTLVLAAALYAVGFTVTETVKQKIVSDFNQTQKTLQKERRLRYERLVDVATIIGQDPAFKANVDLARDAVSEITHQTVLQSVREFAALAPVDLFVVTNRRGILLADFSDPQRYGVDLSARPSVRDVLEGRAVEQTDLPELWAINDEIYQVASAPILVNQSVLIGTLTLGAKLTMLDALDLKGASSAQFHFFLGKKLVLRTDSTLSEADLARFVETREKDIQTAIATGKASEAFEATIGETDVFAYLTPLGKSEPAWLLVAVPKSTELRVIGVLRRNILLFAAASLVVTIALAIVAGRLFSKPILELAEAMKKVQSGNLNVSVKPRTKDEVGQLAENFNAMIIGLRERFELSKYVGSHTLEMVRRVSETGAESLLGGTRQELAVLFSDVRGFTSFSEKRPPEAVVEMLNRYLGFQAKLVEDYGGSVDKFVGDEMVALFAGKDALERAIECAIAIQKRADEEQRRDPAPVYIGIGVNYGTMVLGNIGAEHRRDYTVIGAAVNLGARLCASAEAGKILVRKDLLDRFGLQRKFRVAQVRPMNFKGFSSAIDIAEIACDNEKTD